MICLATIPNSEQFCAAKIMVWETNGIIVYPLSANFQELYIASENAQTEVLNN